MPQEMPDDFHAWTKFLWDQVSQGPNFLGPIFLGTKFPGAQKNQGPTVGELVNVVIQIEPMFHKIISTDTCFVLKGLISVA